ncbi:cytochrome P450 [Pseudanabaena sp. PCC 6802]|uniref:cytochrome P450 n=1 Tax=Pseudanabaena sp. PCC 6802 TaxID=118173 RepID=UPI00034969BF|nr:cytochrome P450 [Pseudanabaena sp. PCC 6802]
MKNLVGSQVHPIWQTLHWLFDPVSYLESNHDRYPDLFISRGTGFADTVILVSHPQAMQQILTNDRKQFSAPKDFNLLLIPVLGDRSLITIDGDRHKKRRQLVMPPFHGDRVRTYGDSIVRATEQVMDGLPKGRPFLARTAMQDISLQIIMETVFGMSAGERYQQLKQVLAAIADLFISSFSTAFLFFPWLQRDLGGWSPWGKFIRLRQQIDALIYAEIAERRRNLDSNRTDVLSLLISARDENGEPMTDEELHDELMTLLIAGHETTATAMAWLLYWAHRYPEVSTKLRQELASLGDRPEHVDISRLPYLTAVCQETLRVYPVAMLTFPRVVQEPVEMMGYQLEPGTVTMGCMYLTHQREDLYPNHTQFRPERFLERQYSPYEFIPFGSGTRRCIGEALAMFEMKLVLATVLSRYQLKLLDSHPEVPRRRGVTLAPARGVRMAMQGRREQTHASLEAIASPT